MNKSNKLIKDKIESCLKDINNLCSNLNTIIMIIKLREIQHELQINRISYLTYSKNDECEIKKKIRKLRKKSNYLHFYNSVETNLKFKL